MSLTGNLYYSGKNGNARKFAQEMMESGIVAAVRAEEGNERFLEIENQVNRDLEAESAVISPGGSVVYWQEAMQHFKDIGVVIYLHATYEDIYKRITNAKNRGVVLKEGQTLKDLYDERVRLFEKYADYTVSEEGLSLEETIDMVLELLDKSL